jgi:hypothetical protein
MFAIAAPASRANAIRADPILTWGASLLVRASFKRRLPRDDNGGVSRPVGQKICRIRRPLSVADAAVYAQPFPESERQKAEEARKKAAEKDTDEAYKSLMKHMPNTNKKIDPWGGLRTPFANPGK